MSVSFKTSIWVVTLLTVANVLNLLVLWNRDDWLRQELSAAQNQIKVLAENQWHIDGQAVSQKYEIFEMRRHIDVNDRQIESLRRALRNIQDQLHRVRLVMRWLKVPQYIIELIFCDGRYA